MSGQSLPWPRALLRLRHARLFARPSQAPSRNLCGRSLRDPAVPADSRAWAATWIAELSRLGGPQSLESWATAAAQWEKWPGRTDAAYCRWRGAQVALASDQGSIALRLLRRSARRNAREHAPSLPPSQPP